MDAIVTIIKWAVVLGLVTAFVAAIAGTFAGMGVFGTDSFYEVQDSARGHVLSPSADNGLLTQIIANTFGYDAYGTQEYQGVIPLMYGFVVAMGTVYLLYWAVRLIRAILS